MLYFSVILTQLNLQPQIPALFGCSPLYVAYAKMQHPLTKGYNCLSSIDFERLLAVQEPALTRQDSPRLS
jgi:hypothetical protein